MSEDNPLNVIYESFQVESQELALLSNTAGIDVEALSGATAVVLYRILIQTYGMPQMVAIELAKLSGPAIDAILQAEDEEAQPTPVAVSITDRAHAGIPSGVEGGYSIVDLQTLGIKTLEEYLEVAMPPITSESIDLKAIIHRIILPTLEEAAAASVEAN